MASEFSVADATERTRSSDPICIREREMDLVKESVKILLEMFERTEDDIGVAVITHEMAQFKISCEKHKELYIKNARRFTKKEIKKCKEMIEFLTNDPFLVDIFEGTPLKPEIDDARALIIAALERFTEDLEEIGKGLAFKEWRYIEKHFMESRLAVFWYKKMKEAKMRDIYIKIAILLCAYSGYLQDFREDLENLENLPSERKKQIRTRIYKWIRRFEERPKSEVLPDFIAKEIEDKVWKSHENHIERTLEQFKHHSQRKSEMEKEAKRGENKEQVSEQI